MVLKQLFPIGVTDLSNKVHQEITTFIALQTEVFRKQKTTDIKIYTISLDILAALMILEELNDFDTFKERLYQFVKK